MVLIFSAFSLFFCLVFLKPMLNFAFSNIPPAKNYNAKDIYNGAGIFIFMYLLLLFDIFIFYMLFFKVRNIGYNAVSAVIIGALSASLTGYIDDSSKDSKKGLIGHAKSLLRFDISSGSIKAAAGISVSIVICYLLGFRGYDFFINALIISLMQNLINLLDLRPLRAIKSYIGVFILLLPFGGGELFKCINFGIIVILLFYAPYEADEICMLGDTGSNTLGILLGILAASLDSIYIRAILFALLAAIHIYAEMNSISALIDRNKALKFIDALGRRKGIDKNQESGS